MQKRRCAVMMVLSLAFLTGCGKQGETVSSEEPVSISVWHYYSGAQQDAFNMLVDEFNQGPGKEKGIVVNVSGEGSVSDLEEDVIAAAEKAVGAKEIPNIFAAYTDTAYKIDQMGLVEDISGYFTEEEKAEYIDSYLTEGDLYLNGELKIFPVAKATEIFMLNQTDWDKFAQATGATLDDISTIEGVTETAKKYYEWTDSLTPEEDDGKAFFGRDAMANYMVVGARQLGTQIISVDAEGNTVFDFPEEVARKLWDNYYVPYIYGYFSSVGRFRSDDVKTGNVIAFVGSSASASFFPSEVILSDEERYPIETGVMEAPGFADGEAVAVQQGAGMVVTKSDEEHVKASVEFLKWFTDTEQNIRFSIASGYLPVKKEANNVETIQKYMEEADTITETIEVSIDTVNNNILYTTPVTENGAAERNVLEYSLSDKAIADRAEIEEQAAATGASPREVAAEYDTDENFMQWYEDITTELQEAVS